MDKVDILDLSPRALEGLVDSLGERPFRAKQIAKWVYRKGVRDFAQMTDIAKGTRELLASRVRFSTLEPSKELRSEDGTVKYLFPLADGSRVESVLIPDGERATLCISTQVGCLLGCTFCLTGTLGKMRDLSVSEIVGQYLAVKARGPVAVTNIVFMGMGEPLDNFENTVGALELLTSPDHIGLSPRRITVSTSGIVPRIRELGERVPVNLSISLNASNDRVRSEIMPINAKYPISELLKAGRSYPVRRQKGVTFEYVLLAGVNDSDASARELAGLLRGMRCMVNLIPFNAAPPLPYRSPRWDDVVRFQNILLSGGVHTMIRKNRGRDILGACGQLAAEYPAATLPRPGRTG